MFLNPYKPIDRHQVNLPHWQQGETWLFVTWRLADSLPKAVVERLAGQKAVWEANHPQPWDEEEQKEYSRRFTLGFEKLLDDAHGECLLAQELLRGIVSDALLHFHGERYHLDTFVIMPNHVHALFHPLGENKLETILQTWKRFTAREINKLRGTEGSLWQREYWDRLIRSEKQLVWTRNYILKNPERSPEGRFTLWQCGEGICNPFHNPSKRVKRPILRKGIANPFSMAKPVKRPILRKGIENPFSVLCTTAKTRPRNEERVDKRRFPP